MSEPRQDERTEPDPITALAVVAAIYAMSYFRELAKEAERRERRAKREHTA